ncbi:MAG: hypothetical protein ACE5IE_06505 [Dehalococcoidia bacterium]
MESNNDFNDDLVEEYVPAEAVVIAAQIYRSHLPPYLQESWQKGKGKWYEDWLREQLDTLVISELCDDPLRLAELEDLQDMVSLVFGIFGASFRLLDHIGMHLRGQTFGQYEVLPEDEELLRDLCKRFLRTKQLDLNPFGGLFPDENE